MSEYKTLSAFEQVELQKRVEALEAERKELENREPVAWIVAEAVDNGVGISVDSALSWDCVENHAYPSTPLYTRPLPAPDLQKRVEELQAHQCQPVCVFHQGDAMDRLKAENAELTKKLAEQQAVLHNIAQYNVRKVNNATQCEHGIYGREDCEACYAEYAQRAGTEELTALLSAARAEGIEEGKKMAEANELRAMAAELRGE